MIPTNDHVIHCAFQLRVTFSDGRTAPVKLVATAPAIDIAVIKVETLHPLDAAASPLSAFAKGIAADRNAVAAAITEPWSNGQTAKLKLLKRQMGKCRPR